MLTFWLVAVAGIVFSFWTAIIRAKNNDPHALALSFMWLVWYVSWLLTLNAFYQTN